MTPREIALSYLSSFSTGDPEAVAAHVAEDFHNDQVGLIGDGCVGRDVYRKRLEGFLSAFQNLQYTPENVIEEDGSVAIAYKMSALDNNHPLDIRGVMIISVADGKITKRSDYWDGLTYKKQMED